MKTNDKLYQDVCDLKVSLSIIHVDYKVSEMK